MTEEAVSKYQKNLKIELKNFQRKINNLNNCGFVILDLIIINLKSTIRNLKFSRVVDLIPGIKSTTFREILRGGDL